MMYSGAEPEFIEGNVYKIIIHLSFGSMTKVGSGTSAVASAQVGKPGGQVVKSSGQVDNAAISIKLDTRLSGFCTIPLSIDIADPFLQFL